jgi:hypothetical protein
MRARTLLLLATLVVALMTAAATPDDAGVRIPASRYVPITSGTKSYRPVDPLPWGEVNRRVAPPGVVPGEQAPLKTPQTKGAPRQSAPRHKH